MTVPGPSAFVIASANEEKAREMREILASVFSKNVQLVERPEELSSIVETGSTLEENALVKARAVRDATGIAAISDDTGLEVEALGGRPGVLSARFAGPAAIAADNVALLLRELDGVEDRRARFRTVAAAALTDGSEISAEGTLIGEIAEVPRGEQGFGYDPVFVVAEAGGRTLAELGADEKHALSHRGRALRALAAKLADAAESRAP